MKNANVPLFQVLKNLAFSLTRNLSEDLTTDKIAEIRAKLISNRRTRIKPEDEDSKTASLALADLEVSFEPSEIFLTPKPRTYSSWPLDGAARNDLFYLH